MSSNVCLDPRPFYNFTHLSCEAPEAPPEASTKSPDLLLAGQPVHPGSPVSLAPQLRGLEHFTSQILQRASVGTSPAKVESIPSALPPLPFLLTGCGSSEDKNLFKNTDDSGVSAGTGGSSTGGSSGTGGTAGTGGSSGNGARDGGIQDSEAGAPPSVPGQAELWSTTPCGSDGTIPDLDQDVGVCANYTEDRHHLFSWNSQNSGSGDGGVGNSILELGFAPDQVLRDSSGKYFITHHGDPLAIPPSPTGLAVVDTGLALQDQVDFTQILLAAPMATSEGAMVIQFRPSFPKGLAQSGDRLFIATSNLVPRVDPTENYFNPGTILIFNTASSSWEHYLTTTDFNPTSMALINGKIYVVNSGDVNPARNGGQTVTTPSSIDVINPRTLEIEKNIPLGGPGNLIPAIDGGVEGGNISPMDGGMDAGSSGARENFAAGIHGEIAISPDGKTIVLPTGDNSGRLIVVDVESETARQISVTTGTKVLLTGLAFHPSSEVLYAGNFNDGKIYTVDLKNGHVVGDQVLDSVTTDFSGISDGLWQSASVFMGVGPEIYRLPVSQ